MTKPLGHPLPDSDSAATQQFARRGIWAVGASSFLSDTGHEMVTSVLPSFITGVLGGSAAALGVIDGLSDALAGTAKVVGGPLANEPRRRRTLATTGYIATAIATSAIGVTNAIWQVGILRAFAWLARGLRSPARDAMLSSLANNSAYGRAFGIERAGDNLGAVVGPLLAAIFVAWWGIRPTMWVALIPGLLAAATILIAARAARLLRTTEARERIRVTAFQLRGTGILRPLIPVLLFECGNVATTLLILRATDALTATGVGGAVSFAIVLYAGHNAVGSIGALVGGFWLDRSSPKVVFRAGAICYVLAYLILAWSGVGIAGLIAGFALAGAGIGLAETAESTMIATGLPDRLRGSGFGLLGGVQAVGDIVATVVAGFLYAIVGPSAAFGYAAGWMLLAVLASVVRTSPPLSRSTRELDRAR